MEILEERLEDVKDLVERASPPRSPGLHCSTVIRDLLKGLDPKTYTDDEPHWTRMSIGFAIEDALGDYWARRHLPYERPGEFRVDGILCSPDGINLSRWRVVEVKCTWRSTKHRVDSQKLWGWMTQIKQYCTAIGTKEAELWAIYVNGDYRDSGPQLRISTLTFNDRELAENRAMIRNHARAQGWI